MAKKAKEKKIEKGSSTLFKNKVFEILADKKSETRLILKYKGKKIDDTGQLFQDEMLFEMMDIFKDEFLDSDAEDFPDNGRFLLEAMSKFESKDVYLLETFKSEGIFTFRFFFSIHDSDIDNLDINPFKHLDRFFSLVNEAGYKTMYDPKDRFEDKNGNVYVSFPAKGNLKNHFQKQLKKLDIYYKKAGKQMGMKNHSIFRK